MKRRKALQSMFLLSAGALVVPGCFTKDEILNLSTNTISFNKRSAEFIDLFSHIILPDPEDTEYSTLESLSDFITNMMNTCHSPEEITKYGNGYMEYREYLQVQFKKSLGKMTDTELDQLLAQVTDENLLSENARFFFSKTRDLRVKHFTSSEYYMTEIDKFEMAPGRFSGCVSLNS